MDITNPPETERLWLGALESEHQKGVAGLQARIGQGRALSPEEIVAALNQLHALDQYYSLYVPTAEALSALGRPSLSQRLAQVRQDVLQATTVFNDMYRSATIYRSQWQQMQRDVQTEIFRRVQESTIHTQSVFDQMNRLQQLVNQGVPYHEALFLVRPPGPRIP